MADLELSFATGQCLRFDPLIDGRAKPEGANLRYSRVHPSELFWRQLSFQEFDVSEMSLSSLFIAASQGVRDWVALPVFPRREFFHNWIMVREGSGIENPRDLVGKRVGVPEYQQTAAVWSRGILKDEFGVDASELLWFMERSPELSHGGATAFTPPAGVSVQQIPPGDNMSSMIARGELDAVLLFITERTLADRSFRADRSSGGGGVRPLFSDPIAEAARYYKATGILPLNHCVVVRRSLVDAHPWLPLNLYHAFEEARRIVFNDSQQYVRLSAQLGQIDLRPDFTGSDPFRYGIPGNEASIQALMRFQVDQGLVKSAPSIEDVFAKSCLSV